VSFGKPISLREFTKAAAVDFRILDSERRFAEVDRLGHDLMRAVGQVVPVLPVSLVATVLLEAGDRSLTSLELKGAAFALLSRLQSAGAHVHIPRQDQEYALEVGLRLLVLRHLVSAQEGVYRANPAETALLRYYANSIRHFLVEPRTEAPVPAALA
jgi:glycerol-3-phosphate O-acyltransferase